MADIAAQEEEVSKSEQPFAKCAFGDERRRLARMFTNYFDRTDSTSGYVANLNGEWGTGKTFFVTEWSKLLKAEDCGVVFIDAWKSDYLDDPLSIVASEVLQQLTEQLENKFDVHDCEKIKNGFWRKSAGLTKAFLPAVTQAVGKNFLGDDTVELIKEFLSGAIDYSEQDVPESLNTKLGKFGEHAFATHQRHSEFVNEFKSELQKLIDLTAEKSGKEKVYIFIDELDRCRPTYAIEMLETIKHLFDIKNLVFIISTDTAQLEHSIKAVYGSGFDSFEYLHRFFKLKLSLPIPDYFQFISMQGFFKDINYQSNKLYPAITTAEQLRAIVAFIAEATNIELRKLENVCNKIDVILSFLDSDGDFTFDAIYAVSFLFTKEVTTKDKSNNYPLYTLKTLSANNECKYKPVSIGRDRERDVYFQSIATAFTDAYSNIINHAGQQGFSLPKTPDGDFTPNSTQAKILQELLNQPLLQRYLRNIEEDIFRRNGKFINHAELKEKIDRMDIFSLEEKQ